MSRALAQRRPWFGVRVSPVPWGSPPVAAALALGTGVGVGVAVVGSPLVALAVAVGVVVAVAVVRSEYVRLLTLIAVCSLLPFAVIPVQLGVQLTMVDALLAAILVGWAVRFALLGRLELTPAGRPLLLYLAVASAALLAGATHGPLSGPIVRSFLKYAAAIALMAAVADIVRTEERVRGLIRALIVGGALAAAIGLAIHALPRPTIVALLSSLSVVGYPSGPEVLRFLPAPNNTYSDTLRATGTSIDPNVFGGLLMLAGALMLAQWFAARPVVPRLWLIPLGAATVAAMLLSYSRSSWVGLAVAGAYLATFRYRRLWLLAIPIGLSLLYLPVGQQTLERLASGFAFRDRAAALRLDEYRQALQLIGEYPVLGVGFSGAPELGTFVGVSSIYFLVGEHTGLVGLSLFLATLAVLLVTSIRALAHTPTPEQRGLILTLQAAVVAALTAGLADHYFMNPRFPHMVALFWLHAGLLAAATRGAEPGLPGGARGIGSPAPRVRRRW